MANLCFDVNLEDTLKDASLPFYALIDKDTDIYYQDFKSVVEARKFRYRRKEQVIEDISESSKTDLLRMAEKKRKARSQYIKVYYQGVMNTKGWIYFKTTSQYTKNKFYTQYIRINEAKDFKYFKEFDKRDIVRLFMSGDLSVYCSCLKNDTQIKLLDGRVLSVEEMEREYRDGKELWVYSTDSMGDFRPGKVTKVWVSGMTEQYIKVTLDNGREILTTGNHPYMLRDGSYLDADKLEVGQSLMPLYFMRRRGYENVLMNTTKRYNSVYKVVANTVFGEEAFDHCRRVSGESSIAIHHVDYNKDNNTPKNLKLMGKAEHFTWHSDYVSHRWNNDPHFRARAVESARAGAVKRNENPTENMISQRASWLSKGHDYWRTEEGRKRKSFEMSCSIKRFWANMSEDEREARLEKHPSKTAEGRKRLALSKKKYWSNLTPEEMSKIGFENGERLNRALGEKLGRMNSSELEAYYRDLGASVSEGKKNMCGKVLDFLLENGLEITEDNYYRYKGKKTPRVGTYFDSFEAMVSYFGHTTKTNHSIVAIEVIDLPIPEPVYDISVDKWENFLVDAGVILHNCPDFLYRGYKYMGHNMGYGIFKEVRFPKIRNPQLEGSVCKHLIAVLKVFGMHWNSIAKDMVKTKYWKKRYED